MRVRKASFIAATSVVSGVVAGLGLAASQAFADGTGTVLPLSHFSQMVVADGHAPR